MLFREIIGQIFQKLSSINVKSSLRRLQPTSIWNSWKKNTHTTPNWFLSMKHILQIGQIFIIDKRQLGGKKWKLEKP